MPADDTSEDPAVRRARLRAARRSRKTAPRPMAVSGKSVFLLKQMIEKRAQQARQRRKARGKGLGGSD